MGFLSGQFLLVPLSAYLAPVVLLVQGYSVGVPLATVPVVLGYVVYGQTLGTTYGLLLEDADLSRPSLPSWRRGTDDDSDCVSLVAGFGGLFAGIILGPVGGTLCIVWQDPVERDQSLTYGLVRVGDTDS
jgi:hypothetical protein